MKFRVTYEEMSMQALSENEEIFLPFREDETQVSTLYEFDMETDATAILNIASRHNIHIPNMISRSSLIKFYEATLAFHAEYRLTHSTSSIKLHKIEYISL